MTEVGSSECTRDDFIDENSPGTLTLGAELDGYVCPQEDVDWYTFTMPPDDRILSVDLRLTAQISPVQPTYAIWDLAESRVLAQPRATDIGGALDDVFCLDPGDFHIAIRDDGDDGQDTRNQYKLTVTTKPDPDTLEPNDAQTQSTALMPGQPQSGAISCAGDRDWYGFQLPEGSLLRFRLDAPQANFQPQVNLIRFIDPDGGQGPAIPEPEVIADESNPRGALEPTAIDRFVVVPGGGQYYLVVSDDDSVDADPDTTYTLSIEFIQDNDANEPNNSPETATDPSNGGVFDCAAGRSATITGTIGSPGDEDWFRIPLANCQRGILDASVVMSPQGSDAAQWEFNSKVQATLTVVRSHAPTPCQRDEECTALNQTCDDGTDCAGYFESCLPDGLCAGATVCLPEGVCGANSVQRRYECRANLPECRPDQTPPPNQAVTSMPILDPNTGYIYVRVSDFQADAADPDTTYTLTLGVRQETDGNEPSNVFTNSLRDFPIGANQARAKSVTVRDATAGGGCNPNSGPWETGTLSYENDTDWFTYPHPCPGEDCTLRIYYGTDSGNVDYVINVYQGRRLWATAFDIEEKDNQTALSGSLGGTTMGDRCFYAFQGHTSGSGTFNYYIQVRDLFELYSDDATVIQESRDFNGSQSYRFCIEKVSNVCAEPPCQVYPNGCGQPE